MWSSSKERIARVFPIDAVIREIGLEIPPRKNNLLTIQVNKSVSEKNIYLHPKKETVLTKTFEDKIIIEILIRVLY